MKEAVSEKITGIKDTIVEGITAAVDFVKELPDDKKSPIRRGAGPGSSVSTFLHNLRLTNGNGFHFFSVME